MTKQRTYVEKDCICFSPDSENYSILASPVPRKQEVSLEIDGRPVASAENLFQALKFPGNAELQEALLFLCDGAHAGRLAGRPENIRWMRTDWMSDNIWLAAMRYVLGQKLAQSPFVVTILLHTGSASIVRKTSHDSFWGAVPDGRGNLAGRNILGRLWMEARQRLNEGPLHPDVKVRRDFAWPVKDQDKLRLLGAPVPEIVIPAHNMPAVVFPSSLPEDASLFEKLREQARLRREAEESERAWNLCPNPQSQDEEVRPNI